MGSNLKWYDYFELFLAMDCLILVIYNIFVLFYRRIYTSWSTSSIIISSSFLLVTRTCCLLYYATKRKDETVLRSLALSAVVSDIPCFFIQMISLALIWQWNRIANLLLSPLKCMNETYQKKSSSWFVLVQLTFLFVFLIDVAILVMHYRYDYWTEGEVVITSDTVIQSNHWTNLRLSYKCTQFTIWMALIIVSGIVFYRVEQAIESDEAFKSLQKQVKTFSWIYFVQLVIRLLGFITFQGIWFVQNYIRSDIDLNYFLRLQEIELAMSSIGELFLNFFLVTYLFLGRSKNSEEEEEEERTQSVLSPRQIISTADSNEEVKVAKPAKKKTKKAKRDKNKNYVQSRLTEIKEELLASRGSLEAKAMNGSSPGAVRKQKPGMHLSQSQGEELFAQQIDLRRSNRDSNLTVSASDEDSSEDDATGALQLDKNNNVIFRTGIYEDQSDQESLDLNRLKHLPQARWRLVDDDDSSHVSDAYTARDSMRTTAIENQLAGRDGSQILQTEAPQVQVLTSPPNLGKSNERSISMRYQSLKSGSLLSSKQDQVKFFVGPGLLMRQVSRMQQNLGMHMSGQASGPLLRNQLTSGPVSGPVPLMDRSKVTSQQTSSIKTSYITQSVLQPSSADNDQNFSFKASSQSGELKQTKPMNSGELAAATEKQLISELTKRYDS